MGMKSFEFIAYILLGLWIEEISLAPHTFLFFPSILTELIANQQKNNSGIVLPAISGLETLIN